ncbi:MAG TPA: protein kinase, partial [Nannocystis sp.]
MGPVRRQGQQGDTGDVEARRMYAKVTERLFGEPSAPVRIGRYRVVERLGSGAMGVVYSAVDERLGRKLAIKLLHESFNGDPTGRARLLREAQAMARLRHENVVLVYDVGTHGDGDEQVFIAMELVEGRTLELWRREAPRSVDEILACYIQAGKALAAAHRAGVLHRDFKPENVLVDAAGRVRVLDFGLARALAGPAEGDPADSLSEPLTRTGSILGTPAYMAPEQLRGESTDARADQFSFCVALYEALYDERPFGTVPRFAAVEVTHVPKDSRVPAHLRRALLRGLADAPADRHADMDALLTALRPTVASRRALVAGLLVVGGAGLGAWAAVSLSGNPGLDFAALHGSIEQDLWVHEAHTRLEAASQGSAEVRDSRRVARFHPLLAQDPTSAALLLRELAPGVEGLAAMRRQVLARPLTRFSVPAEGVRALSFAADVLWIADAGGTRSFTADGRPGPGTPPTPAAPTPADATQWPSPDGRSVLRSDRHGRVFIDRTALREHEGDIGAAAWSPDGQRVAVAGEPGIHVWDRRGKLRRRIDGHEGAVRVLAWSPTGADLLTGGDDGQIRILRVAGTDPGTRVLRGHTGPITALAWHPGGDRIASASADGSVRVWSLVPGARVRHDHPAAVQALAWHPGGELLASAADDGKIHLFSLATAAPPRTLEHGRSVLSIAWSPDGTRLASAAGGDGNVRVWSDTGELLHPLPTHGRRGEEPLAVAWTPAGDLLAACNDERVLLWSGGQGPAHPVAGPRTALMRLAFRPGSTDLATSSVDGAARRWTLDLSGETHALREVGRLDGEVNDLAWCLDGALALAREDRRVDLLAAGGTSLLLQRRTGAAATSVACDPGGGLLVTGLADGRIRLVSRDGATDPADLTGHTAAVDVLAFGPRGDALASADRAGHLYVWPWTDAALAEQLRVATWVCLTPSQRSSLLDEPP